MDDANISDNIKHESPEEFVLILPSGNGANKAFKPIKLETSTSSLTIKLKKFDRKWRSRAKNFESFIVCIKCLRVFKRNANFIQHLCTPNILHCDMCFKTFKFKSDILNHLNHFHMKLNHFECNKCGEKFRRFQSLIIHHNSVRLWKCHACIKTFKCKLLFRKHVKDHGQSFKCNQCSYVGCSMMRLYMHKEVHDKKFSCQTCGEKYLKPEFLETHQMKNYHGIYSSKPIQKIKCNICKRSFLNLRYLKHHRTHMHATFKYQCDYCGKVFKSKPGLITHIYGHATKASCTICKKKFNKYYLKDHFNLQHVLKADFECDLCAKNFKQKKKLKRHIDNSHPRGKFACPFRCFKKFRKIEKLFRHNREHVGIKQWKCKKCSFIANQKVLKLHVTKNRCRRKCR